jgi:sterol desaturase/sphingolipid hydroxylase (fatty acid hydroxylase superfamily)
MCESKRCCARYYPVASSFTARPSPTASADFSRTSPSLIHADFARNAARTVALFLAYDLGFFVDHTLKHRVPALWELHKTHQSAEALTPLVNFRVHPLDSLILANTLALFIGVIGGAAAYLLGARTTSFTLFDDNILMLLYIYLTAQLQHTQIWIPFTGVWGRLFMSPAHHQLHHSADPAHFNCNMGASLAIWDWLLGSLRPPPARSPGLKYGASGFSHDPPSVMGLIVEPACKFGLALAPRRVIRALESFRTNRSADATPTPPGR